MAARDLHGMIIALTTWLADPTRANLILNPSGAQKREIFSHFLPDDATVADTATVVRLGAGSPREYDPFERVGVQIMTRGKLLAPVMERSSVIYDELLDTHRRPLRHITLDADWMLHIVNPAPPQTVGHDEKRRPLAVININITAGLLPE